MSQTVGRVPTVDDLRVKLCYICRDEEHYDNPSNPPVAWVHPCNCTLVAHEICLLNWIRSAQQDAARAPNALKCPQCGALYKIDSDNPFILRLLNNVSSSVSLAGRAVTAFGIVTVVVSCGFGVYVMLTSYGAYAVQEFLGKEMFDLLLTDDPVNWPWHAFINLPLVPLSLIAARTKYVDTLPLYPLLLAWSTSPASQNLLMDNLRISDILDYPLQPIMRWPPSPLMVTMCLPLVSTIYRRSMKRLKNWLLGPEPANGLPLRRIELAINEGGPAMIVRIAADIDPAEAGHEDRRRGQEADDDQPNEDPGAVAEQTMRVTGTSVGRFLGGALMLPKISNWMGTVLFSLSHHSRFLRAFLSIRPPLRFNSSSSRTIFGNVGWHQPQLLERFGANLKVIVNILCGGTKVWAEADPVWWRNTVGLGIFVFAKDCLNLLHVYLTKREIESRHIKNRSFAGIDPRELDLIHPPQNPVI